MNDLYDAHDAVCICAEDLFEQAEAAKADADVVARAYALLFWCHLLGVGRPTNVAYPYMTWEVEVAHETRVYAIHVGVDSFAVSTTTAGGPGAVASVTRMWCTPEALARKLQAGTVGSSRAPGPGSMLPS